MKKTDVRTWSELMTFAKARAQRSARRGDPIAWAYWEETYSFASMKQETEISLGQLKADIGLQLKLVKEHTRNGFSLEAAYAYSRAKWYVILGRNNGLVMSPAKLGMNLKWLHKAAGVPA